MSNPPDIYDGQYRTHESQRRRQIPSRLSHWFRFFGLPTLILLILSQLVFDGELWTLVIYLTLGIGLILFVLPYLYVGALGAAISGLFIDTRQSARNLLLCYVIGPVLIFLGLPWVTQTFIISSQSLSVDAQQALPAGVDISDLTLNFLDGVAVKEKDNYIRTLVASGQVKRLMVTYAGRLDNYKYYEVRPNVSCANNLYQSCLKRKKFYLSKSYVLDVSVKWPDKTNILFRELSPIRKYITVSLRTPDGVVMGRGTAQILRPIALPLGFDSANNGSSVHFPDTILSRDEVTEDPLNLLAGLDNFINSSVGLRTKVITPPKSKLISDEDFESEIIRQRFAQAESQKTRSIPAGAKPKIAPLSRNYQGFIYTARRRNWPQEDVDFLVNILSDPEQDCSFVNNHLYAAAMIEERTGAIVRATFKCLGQRQGAKRKSMAAFNEGLTSLQANALKPFTTDIIAFFELGSAKDLSSLWPLLMESESDLSRVWQRQLALDNRSTFTTMQALDQICGAPSRHQTTGLAALHARLSGFGVADHPRARGTSMAARIISILDGFGEADAYLNTMSGRETRDVPKFIRQRQAAKTACPPWGNPPY